MRFRGREREPALLVACSLLASLASGCGTETRSLPLPCPGAPQRGEASANRPEDALRFQAYDTVNLPGGGSFFVLYSKREADDGTSPCSPSPQGSPENTSDIFLFPLEAEGSRDAVLVFGAGYGDWCLASYGADCDARQVAYVIREELGFAADSTELRFVAPHGHLDHINPEFLSAVEALGFAWIDISFHAADFALEYPQGLSIQAMSWTPEQRAKLVPLTKPSEANRHSGAFPSPLGSITFLHRPGHTPGSLDLVLTGIFGSMVVRGSVHQGHERGYVFDLKPHGNALLTQPD